MIGEISRSGLTLHADHCPCALCCEHRALAAIIQESEQRGYYVGPAARLDLEQIERDLAQGVSA